MALLVAAFLIFQGCAPKAPPTGGLHIAEEHVQAAAALAGEDLRSLLFLCSANPNAEISARLAAGKTWLEPVQVFDDLFWIGNRFVGVWVLKTSGGLILFDSTESVDDAKTRLEPGLRALGLDPAEIKYVIVTHGHWDHFGGAPYLQDARGARIALGQADWHILETAPKDGMEIENQPVPRRDLVVGDSQKLTLGETTITLYLTPGHTPGTVSALVPVHEGGRAHVLSLYGSTAFPPIRGANNRTGGLAAYSDSVRRFSRLSAQARAEGVLNTHAFVDGSLDRIAALKTRRAGDPNPFLIGEDAVARYYRIFDHCLQAAIARPEGDGEWAHAFPE